MSARLPEARPQPSRAADADDGDATGLLDLPDPLLESILAACGSGARGAYASCTALRSAWRTALSHPSGAAAYLLSRYGAHGAEVHVYDHPGLLAMLPAARTPPDTAAAAPAAAAASREEPVRELLAAISEADPCAATAPPEGLKSLWQAAAMAGHVAVMTHLQRRHGVGWVLPALEAVAQRGSPDALRALLAAMQSGELLGPWAHVGCGGVSGAPAGGAVQDQGSAKSHLPLSDVVSSLLVLVVDENAGVDNIRALLEAGADPWVRGCLPLRVAAHRGFEATVGALLETGAHDAEARSQALGVAVAGNHGPAVSRLLEVVEDPDTTTLFLITANKGWEEAARALLSAGADPRTHDDLALVLAAYGGHVGMVAMLLDVGVPAGARGGLALAAAIAQGHTAVEELLRSRGAGV
ncbi:hypothetical protein GPECTOR_28g794 [Gonium pectorale]|uniref:F-box domain-containing protein n=1 Tax=Gonium pectorale TaxID=33097 RepID=A0A150GEV8_GONPE|nr:hypothetical protein GPECTOR_28g794 [Gonium pectorale]|eukprot:KXZ48387.1 hypothetical protein GPECTOR_28g794 [Gonium pectorale]